MDITDIKIAWINPCRSKSCNWIFWEQNLKGSLDKWITGKKDVIWEQFLKFILRLFVLVTICYFDYCGTQQDLLSYTAQL